MMSIFGKRKLSDNQVSNIFVNTILDSVENGWPEVSAFISDSPEFVKSPNLDSDDYGRFLMIVIAANFCYIPKHFEGGHDSCIIKLSVEKFASVFDLEVGAFAKKVKDYKQFLSRVNIPSKNTLYAMSKAVFFKYELNQFQEPYFQSLKTPNPIFLKNLDEVMKNFLWDWNAFQDKFKVVDNNVVA
jgi:hypothetical protein